MGLQLSRANTLALTRLQLAIQSGDRQQAMAAMDRLHTIDAELERLVDDLPVPSEDDADWLAITRHLGDQKLAVAFEKLALASGISGPDLVSPPPPLTLSHPIDTLTPDAAPEEPPPPLPEWPALPAVEPTEWRPARSSMIVGLVAAVAVTLLMAAAAMLITAN